MENDNQDYLKKEELERGLRRVPFVVLFLKQQPLNAVRTKQPILLTRDSKDSRNRFQKGPGICGG